MIDLDSPARPPSTRAARRKSRVLILVAVGILLLTVPGEGGRPIPLCVSSPSEAVILDVVSGEVLQTMTTWGNCAPAAH